MVNKLLLQTASKAPEIAVDNLGVLFAGSGTHNAYGLSLKNLEPYFFAGLFSSKVLDFYVKHMSSVFSGGFYSYGDQFIKDLPIPPATKEQQAHISSLAQSLTEKTAALHDYDKALATFPDSVTAARRAEGDVPDLESLARLGHLENLPQELRAGRLSSEGDLTGQVVLRAGNGRMTLKPTLARLVEKILNVRGKMRRDELAALSVPERDAEQRAYLERLAVWQDEMAALQGEIAGLEAALNEAVYEVYRLEDEEQKVIEGFLERF